MFAGLKKKFADLRGTSAEPTVAGHAKAPEGERPGLRDALFADATLDKLLEHISAEAQGSGPFAVFAAAAEARRSGDANRAVELLKTLTEGQESRVELLAWTALREIGVQPTPERAKEVLGVVVEVAMSGDEDLVAAYPEHTARYYNYSGAGIVWETDDPRLNPQIDALLQAGRSVVAAIGPWEQERPGIPAKGRVRINMLTPSGLHFGEGPMSSMPSDPLGGPVIKAAFELMQALIAVDAEYRKGRHEES